MVWCRWLLEAEMGRRILQCGYDFLKYWEKGPRKKEPRKKGVRLTPEGAALDAYQCSAAKWTIGFGCTEYEDGRRVRAGDTITPDQVMPLLMANVARFEALVDRLLTKDASDVMFTAHVLFAFNVGPHAYTASSLLRECNAARAPTDWRNAVDNFYSYSGVTTYAPSDAQLADAAFASKIGRNADGDPVWVNTKGEPCGFMLRSRGLVKRHMGEACLALGYDGARACEDSDLLRIDITIKHPDTAYFEERRNRWVSRIDEITDFSKVLEIAQRFPLPQPEAPQPAPAEDEARPAETSAAPAPQPKHEPVVESPQPTPAEAKPVSEPRTVSFPTAEPPADTPFTDLKSMLLSRRFWGWFLIIFGRGAIGSSLATHIPGGVGEFVAFIVGDSIMFETTTGVLVMVAGEALKWYGTVKATKALK